jgi:hypothetical protein
VVRLNLAGADVLAGTPAVLREALVPTLRPDAMLGVPPTVRLLIGNRLVDLIGDTSAGALHAAETALERAAPEASVVAVVER